MKEPASTGRSAVEGELMPMSWDGSAPETCVLGDPYAGQSAPGAMGDMAPGDAHLQLKRLVSKLTTDVTLHEDLVQEASVHLWRCQQQDPGRAGAWYLQSCRFHLQNLLRQGRSVDAWKRRGARLPEFEAVEWLDKEWSADSAGDPSGALEARELFALLSAWLTPQERRVLQLLVERLSARAIGRRLGISHTMVNRVRRRIAAVAVKLGLAP